MNGVLCWSMMFERLDGTRRGEEGDDLLSLMWMFSKEQMAMKTRGLNWSHLIRSSRTSVSPTVDPSTKHAVCTGISDDDAYQEISLGSVNIVTRVPSSIFNEECSSVNRVSSSWVLVQILNMRAEVCSSSETRCCWSVEIQWSYGIKSFSWVVPSRWVASDPSLRFNCAETIDNRFGRRYPMMEVILIQLVPLLLLADRDHT